MSDKRIDSEKESLRLRLKARRSFLDPAERAAADEGIARKLVSLPEFSNADTLFAYCSFGSEVATQRLIEEAWACGKTVALPRCVEGTRLMEWYAVDSLENLVRSSFGVREPRPDETCQIDATACSFSSIALVPGLAFDMQGYRIGYGAGFYDMFLATFPGASVGLCREAFLLERLSPIDDHDLPVDIVVTQKRTLRARADRGIL